MIEITGRKPIRKAVFPVAGLGTRFLPATKAIPKEMLPIIDRPLIQYAVDEAREAGIEQLIFVTGLGHCFLPSRRGPTKSTYVDPTFSGWGIIQARQQVPACTRPRGHVCAHLRGAPNDLSFCFVTVVVIS